MKSIMRGECGFGELAKTKLETILLSLIDDIRQNFDDYFNEANNGEYYHKLNDKCSLLFTNVDGDYFIKVELESPIDITHICLISIYDCNEIIWCYKLLDVYGSHLLDIIDNKDYGDTSKEWIEKNINKKCSV